MKLRFLGTGTSTGIPMVGCSCDVCRSADVRNSRRRASVLISGGDRHWLVDAGPDFRKQALDAGLQLLSGVFLTHSHADHILGLDDLRPLSWKQTIPVWADQTTSAAVHRAFPYFFSPGDGKTSRPKLDFHIIEPLVSFDAEGLSVLPIPIRHGDATILGFRFGNLAYLTDCNGLTAESQSALGGLETLILGALRYKEHPTHFSIDQAVEAAQALGAQITYLTHFSHDIEHSVLAEQLPSGIAPAYDGLEVDF